MTMVFLPPAWERLVHDSIHDKEVAADNPLQKQLLEDKNSTNIQKQLISQCSEIYICLKLAHAC